MLLTDILNLLLFGFSLVIIAALIAPFESLGWWAGWFNSKASNNIDEPNYQLQTQTNTQPQKPSDNYIVFLDGISRASRQDNVFRTADFIQELETSLTNVNIISDIFPYSPQGQPLTEKRLLSFFWTILEDSHEKHFWHRFRQLINIRNLLQVLVSSDRRYGPIFNKGAASYIANALLEAGYIPNSGKTIYLIGYSGGAQISVGVAPFLQETLKAPLVFISIGGVFVGNKDLTAFKKIHHLLGTKDFTSKRSILFFPSRWWILKNSSWNRLRQQGLVEIISMPSVTHNGKQSYFDSLEHSYLEDSIRKIKDIIEPTNASKSISD